jgi:PAS domain-containing protein
MPTPLPDPASERGFAEAVLAHAAVRLAVATTTADVFEVALTATCDLAPWRGDSAVALFAGDADALELIAGDGFCMDWPLGTRRPAEQWGELVAAAARRCEPVATEAEGGDPADGGGAPDAFGGCRLAQPLLFGGRLRGVVLVASSAPLAAPAAGALATLAFEVALALDRLERARELKARGVEPRSLVLGSPDLVLLVDADGRVHYLSPALAPILEQKPGWVVGNALAELFADGEDDASWLEPEASAPPPSPASEAVN